jgi:hypothetical protein
VHHPIDEYVKVMADACLSAGAEITREHVVHVPPQRIDVTFEPRARVPALGVVDRMFALGPGMIEHFASLPSHLDVKECLRKRLAFEHERVLSARRRGEPTPPEPLLWILSTGRPRKALRAVGAAPMPGWPTGFWQAAFDEFMCFVLLHELPETLDTLPLRLIGRGRTLQRAVMELFQLPAEHPLRIRALPVVVAHQPSIVQDLKRNDDMNLEQTLQAYREYEQRIRNEEAQRVRQEEALRLEHEALRIRQEEAARMQHLLIRLLTHRFGALPEGVLARIQQADTATLGQWADRELTAQSLDDVFA